METETIFAEYRSQRGYLTTELGEGRISVEEFFKKWAECFDEFQERLEAWIALYW